jgi:hypothetical protein
MASADFRCSEDTPRKQEDLEYILKVILPIWKGIRRRPGNDWARRYPILYVDLYAGPGVDDFGNIGSPLIFDKLAQPFMTLPYDPLPFNAHFYEKNPDQFEHLASVLQHRNYHLHCASNRTAIDILPKWRVGEQYGLVYADPSNAPMGEISDLCRPFAQQYKRVDILINYAAASWKRQCKLDHYRHLTECLRAIGKRHILIRAPRNKHQWTMLFLTNYPGFPTNERRHWYDITTPEGYAYYRRVNYTKNELRGFEQPALFEE